MIMATESIICKVDVLENQGVVGNSPEKKGYCTRELLGVGWRYSMDE
jgi:hypothetical protein